MPRPMPPATTGGAAISSWSGGADAGVAAGIGAPGGSPGTEPTSRSAGAGAGARSDACAVAAGGGAHRPSDPTRSSAPTGPRGPRLTWAVLGRAQSGLAKISAGFENQPPSLLSSKTCAVFLQPPTSNMAQQ